MISFLKRAEPVTLQRSPILTNRAPAPASFTRAICMGLGGNEHWFEAGEQGAGTRSRDGARRAIAHRPGNGGDVQGSRPATTADDVDQAVLGPVANLGCGLIRRLIIFAELVGQPGVWIGHDQGVRERRKRAEVRPELGSPERAVEA